MFMYIPSAVGVNWPMQVYIMVSRYLITTESMHVSPHMAQLSVYKQW